MERVDLLNALRLVSDYCKSKRDCDGCMIKKECESLEKGWSPCGWDLDDDV